MYGDDVLNGDLAGPHVYLDLGEVRTKSALR